MAYSAFYYRKLNSLPFGLGGVLSHEKKRITHWLIELITFKIKMVFLVQPLALPGSVKYISYSVSAYSTQSKNILTKWLYSTTEIGKHGQIKQICEWMTILGLIFLCLFSNSMFKKLKYFNQFFLHLWGYYLGLYW